MHQYPTPLILGSRSSTLSADEKELFKALKPLGLILFARNCDSPKQLLRLTEEFRQCVDNPSALVLIDQEGGRVSRLPQQHWRVPPSPTVFAELYQKDKWLALEAMYLNYLLIGRDLREVGINVNCAPMLDIAQPDAAPVVTDRAYGYDPDSVTELAKMVVTGLHDAGVEAVIKHAPGHGRATCDSHFELPHIDASLLSLDKWDFVPFKALNNCAMMMTAHIVYDQISPNVPATLNPDIMTEIIRTRLGFTGLVMTDDIDMKALCGTIEDRAKQAFLAGCDVVLQCDGDITKMRQLQVAMPEILQGLDNENKHLREMRINQAIKGAMRIPKSVEYDESEARLEQILVSQNIR